MNRPESPSRLIPIPDVQAERDERRIAIERVGIKGLRYPLPFADGDAPAQATIATCNVYVTLPESQKGTHMSRLVELLEERALSGAEPLTVAGLRGVRRGAGRAARRARRPHRDRLSILRSQDGAGVGRCEPRRFRRATHRGARRRRVHEHDRHRGARDVALSVLEGDLGVRRAQPALARDGDRAASRERARDRARANGGGRSVVRALRHPEARRREVRDGARVRQSALRRRPRARRRAAARGATAASRPTPSKPRTSSRSTTIRRTLASRVAGTEALGARVQGL